MMMRFAFRLPAPTVRRARILLPLVALAVALIALAGCSVVRTPEGWSSAEISGDAVYIGTMQGELLALDKTTGDTLWKRPLPTPEDSNRAIYGKPAVSNGLALVGGYDGRLYAYDAGGDLVWQERLGGRIVGGPATTGDGLALVGTGGVSSSDADSPGTLSAIDVETNDEIWRVEMGGPIWASPAIADGVAYVGSMDHHVYAIDVASGDEKWRYRSGGAVVSQAAVYENLVIFGGFDSRLYALNAETGERVWVFTGSTRWYWASPLVAGGTVYAPSLDGTLYALDAKTGNLKWRYDSGGQLVGSPTVVNGLIAVPVADGGESKIALLEPNGSQQQACRIGADIRTSLAASDDMIYFAATDRTIVALRIKPNGNPDEEWVYVTNADDPYPPGRAKAC